MEMCHLAVAHLFFILSEQLRVVINESKPTELRKGREHIITTR